MADWLQKFFLPPGMMKPALSKGMTGESKRTSGISWRAGAFDGALDVGGLGVAQHA